MTTKGESAAKRYHHGDLSRALLAAARHIVEAEGPSALSLRAVAREAGVSAAAPYHHFKDKAELLSALADQGWRELGGCMVKARQAVSEEGQLTALGAAYVVFARANPALYRVMFEAVREGQQEPNDRLMREALIARGATPGSPDLTFATLAAWSAVHGLADLAGMRRFDELKAELGGERAFLEAVLDHMRVFPSPRRD